MSTANTIVWRWENTHPFGANLPDEDPDGNAQLFEYHPRFPGQYFDKETNLHYNYFRYYEPETGRYVSPDPIGLTGGINIYGYAKQNPLSFVDQNGLWAIGDPLPQGIVDAVAGFGDSLTFGITYGIREAMNINNVNMCSRSYLSGVGGGLLVHVIGFRTGGELSIGRNIRIAPWGNRTGHPAGELPHYHRRGKIGIDGRPLPGQGKNRHRPWEGF